MKRERAEKLFNLLGEIDDEIIAEADIVETKSAKILPLSRKKVMQRYVTIAASIAFLLVCIWGVRGLVSQFDMHGDDMTADEADSDFIYNMVVDEDQDDADWDDDIVAEAEDAGWDDEDEEDENEQEELADRPVDFIHQLTEDELNAVFPTLDYEISATALFLNDGTLIEVEGFVHMPTGEQLRLRVAEGEIQHTVIAIPDEILNLTIHEVELTVYDQVSTSFMLDDIAYYMEFFDEDVINQIILGGPADLNVLSDVVIP